jgi:putative Ca2+/H+ antiporter (TMEM165/GDT1 family)
LNALLVSCGVVALAEIGDKTQLLSLILAARFHRPLPILAGILAATRVNHAIAGALGVWIHGLLDPVVLRWVLALSFAAMALWCLVPDTIDARPSPAGQLGVFGTTLIAFFLAEMGDKTQVATVALAAQQSAFVAVVAGTTLGMMLANAPAVLLGDRIAHRMPVRLVHGVAATLFLALAVATLLGAGSRIGL